MKVIFFVVWLLQLCVDDFRKTTGSAFSPVRALGRIMYILISIHVSHANYMSDPSQIFAVWISCDTRLTQPFLSFLFQREVIHAGMCWTVIPVDSVNLHRQKDNSNDIHLISLDRFRTCFSLTQKWIREQ